AGAGWGGWTKQFSLVEGLGCVCRRLEPGDAARVTGKLVQALQEAKNGDASRWYLAGGLSGPAGQMDPKGAVATLTQAMKDPRNTGVLQQLALVLSRVSARLEPGEAAATLTQALGDARQPLAVLELAQGLTAAAARLEPEAGARAAGQAAAA